MGFLSNFFKKEEVHALGIDIGSSAIKIVQIKKKNGQAVLETYGELALGPYGGVVIGQSVNLPSEKISQALVDLMNEKEVNVTTRRSGLSIPFSASLITELDMPDVGEKQLSTMVPIEARKYIPVPITDVMLDWSVIPKSEIEKESIPELGEPAPTPLPANMPPAPKRVDILLVAIHKDTINRYQDIVQRAGLEASFFEIEIFATCRAVLDEAMRPVLIMDMGAATTKLYVVERGVIRTSHTVNHGSQDITATMATSLGITPEQAEVMKREVGLLGPDPKVKEVVILTLDHIFTEVNNVMLSFEKKYNKTISKVLLVGGGAALKGLAEVAKNNFKTEVEIALPFNKLSTPAFLDNILRETGPEFAVAIGLALRKLSEE